MEEKHRLPVPVAISVTVMLFLHANYGELFPLLYEAVG